MTRGNVAQTKVLFQGEKEDFIVFVESAAELEAWKRDRSIPLAQVVAGFKIMVSHKCVHYMSPSVWRVRKADHSLCSDMVPKAC
jgi:hypothetical protein